MTSTRLSDYSNIASESLVIFLTIAPILVLIYFYPELPSQVPVFLNLRGEVEVWAPKSVLSVFRVPAMAIDTQLVCFLMKYGTVKSQRKRALAAAAVHGEATRLTAGLWDWLRLMVAFKMSAASLDVLFMSNQRLAFLWTPAWLLTWVAVVLAIVAACWYGYRLWKLKRKSDEVEQHVQDEPKRSHLIGGFIYCDTKDPALFVERYLLNFGNKWVYVLLASLLAYPVLVFVGV